MRWGSRAVAHPLSAWTNADGGLCAFSGTGTRCWLAADRNTAGIAPGLSWDT